MTYLETLKEEFNKTDLVNHCEDLETALGYYDGEPDADDFSDWYRETYVDHAEVIYYHNAVDYLKENDPSLTESMALASEFGYDASNLNSELLATLLLQQSLNEELSSLRGALDDYFTSLEEAA